MASADGAERSIKINRQYLNFPVSHSLERKAMTFTVDGRKESRSVIRLAEGAADYWTFRDVSQLRGKTICRNFSKTTISITKKSTIPASRLPRSFAAQTTTKKNAVQPAWQKIGFVAAVLLPPMRR